MKQARLLPPTPDNIELAAQAIRRGDVVAMPTETVYGLAGDAFNESALQKIFKTKERPTFDPLIVHVRRSLKTLELLSEAGIVDLKQIHQTDAKVIDSLLSTFWPGPLTIVLPKQMKIPDLATSGLPSVAVRMPLHKAAQDLLEACGQPLAAPSANRFGRISPTTAAHVQAELGDRIDLILDGGPCNIGVESTVIALLPQGIPLRFALLRPGGTAASAIEAITGPLAQVLPRNDGAALANQAQVSPGLLSPGLLSPGQLSPGMLASHYAPRKGLTLLPRSVSQLSVSDASHLKSQLSSETRADIQAHTHEPLGLLLISGSAAEGADSFSKLMGRKVVCRTLSETGDLDEAARQLFSELRFLDASAAVALFAEPCLASHGLGHAIADRLKRASVK